LKYKAKVETSGEGVGMERFVDGTISEKGFA
jgi:hypothetical protein